MSVFLETNHLFLRSPGGEVENAKLMREAGFGAIFCNCDPNAYRPEDWDITRRNASSAGIACGPWLRTADEHNEFDAGRFVTLIDIADAWNWAPLIVNCEKEIDHTGDDITGYIAEELGDRDAAISMEVRPFGAVDWSPLARAGYPVLPQNFPAETGIGDTDDAIRANWWRAGFNCVVITCGAYHGMSPGDFDLEAPFGVYSGNDCGGNFQQWAARGTCDPCRSAPPTPPNGGGDDVAEPLPPGAFDDCAKYETTTMKRPDGKDATAFNDRAKSLKAQRDRIMQLEDRIIALEKRQ